MTSIAVVFCTGAGHTRVLAETIAGGITSNGSQAHLIDVQGMNADDWAMLKNANAIVFGAPTYMGSAAGAFKTFMDHSSDIWMGQTWANKLAAGFTVATFPGGDKLATLIQLSVFAAQHGMIWVGQDQIGSPVDPDKPGINASGTWLGLAATSSRDKSQMIEPGDLETARGFGARIAGASQRWAKGAP